LRACLPLPARAARACRSSTRSAIHRRAGKAWAGSLDLAGDCRMIHPTPLYIVASPRQRVGKTLIARLLIDFLLTSDRPLEGYDLDPHEPTLAKRFPGLVVPIDIGDISGQMQLFDRLLAHESTTKVIDLGCGPFAQFFAVMRETDFVIEARRRSIEPIVLFVADPQTATVHTYGELRRQFETTTFLPVHNQAVSITFTKEDFPPTRTEYGLFASRVCRLWCAV
jgi:hypothetical protein